MIINPSDTFTFGGYVVDNASCLGPASGKIFLTGLTLPTSAYTINWSPSVLPQSGETITGLTAGTYVATVTNSVGCVDSQSFTVNNVTKKIYKSAHQTSARYPLLINEAEVNGLKT